MQELQGIVVHKTEFNLGPLPLTGFGIAMLGAFVIAQIVAQTELDRRGKDGSVMADVVIAAVIGGLLGGKIYYAILVHDVAALAQRAGFVFWGGLLGGIIGTYGWIRYKKLSFAEISDVSAIGIAVAKTRTESPKARVAMNVIEAKRRVASPNRFSRRAYAVTSSPST